MLLFLNCILIFQFLSGLFKNTWIPFNIGNGLGGVWQFTGIKLYFHSVTGKLMQESEMSSAQLRNSDKKRAQKYLENINSMFSKYYDEDVNRVDSFNTVYDALNENAD